MSLFRLDASILPGTSTSVELPDLLETENRAGRPDEPVVRRVLGTDPLPAEAWKTSRTWPLVGTPRPWPPPATPAAPLPPKNR